MEEWMHWLGTWASLLLVKVRHSGVTVLGWAIITVLSNNNSVELLWRLPHCTCLAMACTLALALNMWVTPQESGFTLQKDGCD